MGVATSESGFGYFMKASGTACTGPGTEKNNKNMHMQSFHFNLLYSTGIRKTAGSLSRQLIFWSCGIIICAELSNLINYHY